MDKQLIRYAIVNKFYSVVFAETMELLDVVYRFLLGVLLETKRLDNIAIRSTKTEHTFVDRTQDKQCNEIYNTIGKLYFIRHARI